MLALFAFDRYVSSLFIPPFLYVYVNRELVLLVEQVSKYVIQLEESILALFYFCKAFRFGIFTLLLKRLFVVVIE